MPEPDIIRHRLNLFVASSDPFVPVHKWEPVERSGNYTFPTAGALVFAIDQTPEDTYATITAHRRDELGTHHTELVAWLVNPGTEQLLRLCERLWAHSPASYAMDGMKLQALGFELRKRGFPVHIGTASDAVNASSQLFPRALTKTIVHGGEPLLTLQMPRAIRKNKGDVYGIDRASSSVEIDAVTATVLGTLVPEQTPDTPLQVFG